MPARSMVHERDPKEVIFEKVGNLDGQDIFFNGILCAIYQRPEKTKSGIIYADQTRDEDNYQGKVGLILKTGPLAFKGEDGMFEGSTPSVGDWVYFRASDGMGIEVNGVKCRRIKDSLLLGKTDDPDSVW